MTGTKGSVLAYLAARSLPGRRPLPGDDEAPALRPRLPSLYERPEPTGLSALEQEAEIVSAGTPRRAIAHRRQQPRPELPSSPVAPDGGPSPAQRTTAEARADRIPSPLPAAREQGDSAVRDRQPSEPPHPSRPESPVLAAEAARPQSSPARGTPAPERAPAEPRPRQTERTPVPREPESSEPHGIVPRHRREAWPGPAPPPFPPAPPERRADDHRAIVARPLATGLATTPAARREHSAPLVPHVQVTIGRIEIRASAPPPAAKRQAPRAPGVSLDEYLARRGKG